MARPRGKVLEPAVKDGDPSVRNLPLPGEDDITKPRRGRPPHWLVELRKRTGETDEKKALRMVATEAIKELPKYVPEVGQLSEAELKKLASQDRVTNIDLQKLIGGYYNDFWNFKGRYRNAKGSRASKKSVTCGFYYVIMLALYPEAHLLCVRRYEKTLRRSCFNVLQWCIRRLGMDYLWKFIQSPLEATFLPTGQKIYFMGLDDPQRITSITVPFGYLCWAWIEELYEIQDEAKFNMLDHSIRGPVPDGYFKQITTTFNPWTEFWAKPRFFDRVDPDHENFDPTLTKDIFCGTYTWMMNEFLDDADKRMFEILRKNDPERYLVAGLGKWGAPSGSIFNAPIIKPHINTTALYVQYKNGIRGCGLDWGWTAYGGLLEMFVDVRSKKLWVLKEHVHRGLTNQEIAEDIKKSFLQNWPIVYDDAEPKSRSELIREGIQYLIPSRKGPDSVLYSIQYMRQYTIIVDQSCSNFISEMMQYHWAIDNETGETLEEPDDSTPDHLISCARYFLGWIERQYDFGAMDLAF
jgi:phage terminase large subunit